MRALEASTPDARSVAGWYSAYRAGRVSLGDAAWALHREGAALPSRQKTAYRVRPDDKWEDALLNAQGPFMEETMVILQKVMAKAGVVRIRHTVSNHPGAGVVKGLWDDIELEIGVTWSHTPDRIGVIGYGRNVQLHGLKRETPKSLAEEIWRVWSRDVNVDDRMPGSY